MTKSKIRFCADAELQLTSLRFPSTLEVYALSDSTATSGSQRQRRGDSLALRWNQGDVRDLQIRRVRSGTVVEFQRFLIWMHEGPKWLWTGF